MYNWTVQTESTPALPTGSNILLLTCMLHQFSAMPYKPDLVLLYGLPNLVLPLLVLLLFIFNRTSKVTAPTTSSFIVTATNPTRTATPTFSLPLARTRGFIRTASITTGPLRLLRCLQPPPPSIPASLVRNLYWAYTLPLPSAHVELEDSPHPFHVLLV